jgi:CRP-like cAMP-binding protein
MKEVRIDVERMEPLLEQLFLFKSLSADMKRSFLDEASLVIAQAGEEVIREGEREEAVFILVEGEVEVCTLRDGQAVFLALLTPNAIIGEMSAMSGAPRTATVVAAGPCSLIRLKAPLVRRLVDENPKVRKLLAAIAEGRRKDTQEKLSE